MAGPNDEFFAQRALEDAVSASSGFRELVLVGIAMAIGGVLGGTLGVLSEAGTNNTLGMIIGGAFIGLLVTAK